MDNDFLQLSAGESIYLGYNPPATAPQAGKPAEMITLPLGGTRPAKRRAGRLPLSQDERERSAQRLREYNEAKKAKRAKARDERKAENARIKAAAAEQKLRVAEAKKAHEADKARANSKAPAELPPTIAYQVLYTDASGTRHVKVDSKTTLQVPAEKSVDDAVSRYLNRTRIIF